MKDFTEDDVFSYIFNFSINGNGYGYSGITHLDEDLNVDFRNSEADAHIFALRTNEKPELQDAKKVKVEFCSSQSFILCIDLKLYTSYGYPVRKYKEEICEGTNSFIINIPKAYRHRISEICFVIKPKNLLADNNITLQKMFISMMR